MREIALFVEDFAHEQFLRALLGRLSAEHGLAIAMKFASARRGHGAVIRELRQYLRDLERGRLHLPDLIIVATDANCSGFMDRLREIREVTGQLSDRIVCAIPVPHIERWLMADSLAFKAVFGRGCNPPDQKCERGRYKRLLIEAIRAAGAVPNLGGIEFSGDIIDHMDLGRAAQLDESFGRLIDDLRAVFRRWS